MLTPCSGPRNPEEVLNGPSAADAGNISGLAVQTSRTDALLSRKMFHGKQRSHLQDPVESKLFRHNQPTTFGGHDPGPRAQYRMVDRFRSRALSSWISRVYPVRASAGDSGVRGIEWRSVQGAVRG